MTNYCRPIRRRNNLKGLELDKIFWSRVSIKNPDECWEFKDCRNNSSYGIFRSHNKSTGAHRFAWESFHKTKIPKEKLVLHKCDNPACCNPAHLFLGTHSDNTIDAGRKGRRSLEKIACTQAKLYAKDIQAIRKLKGKYKYSQERIAKLFKISQNTISRIWRSSKYPCREGFYV